MPKNGWTIYIITIDSGLHWQRQAPENGCHMATEEEDEQRSTPGREIWKRRCGQQHTNRGLEKDGDGSTKQSWIYGEDWSVTACFSPTGSHKVSVNQWITNTLTSMHMLLQNCWRLHNKLRANLSTAAALYHPPYSANIMSFRPYTATNTSQHFLHLY